MQLRFLGKSSNPDDSPTLYATDHDSYVIQGYDVTDPAIQAQLHIGTGETVVQVPADLMAFLANDGLPATVTTVTTPIVHTTDTGDYIVQGRHVTEPETLAQMRIPAGESCVEVAKPAVVALVGG